jgi:hypothetical protein
MLRGFTDAGGTEWRVWQVLPSPMDSQQDPAESLTRMSLNGTPFAKGWLCFESAVEKRRLAPIPEGWEFLDAAILQDLCERAQLVPVRRARGQSTDAVGAA